MKTHLSRRHFLKVTSAGAASLNLIEHSSLAVGKGSRLGDKLAILGGKPVRAQAFPSWPVIGDNDRRAWSEVLESKRWNRLGGSYVERFEKAWAQQLGAKYGLATANGTSALVTAFQALDIGPGDEVVVPPYTFVATINIVLLHYAIPIFADTDLETFQIDSGKIAAAITNRTRCILPVHFGGSASNMDEILKVAQKHKLPVVEDACQAHLAEWRHRKVGTLGDLGCFSFQASKNLNCGEGGAIVTNNEELMEICASFHNQGRAGKPSASSSYARNGDNRRLTEFQGALLLEQLTRLEAQSHTRAQNAVYLSAQLREIPGITPARMYDGCTRNAYHLYMFRYDKSRFTDLPRLQFLKALHAEGVPCSGGYAPLNKEPFLKQTLHSRGFQRIYSPAEIADYEQRNSHCPMNDKLCGEAVWLTQNMLLGSRSDMDQIAEAVRKIQKQAELLLRP
ncbi:MAG TPA: DegT/DnrJ/EryC1/StrS family aminotransferase [Acidobacteriota bacterium]|jgi:dTDP-4-amino-4,6-dideoxygalactose transaminase